MQNKYLATNDVDCASSFINPVTVVGCAADLMCFSWEYRLWENPEFFSTHY